MWKNREKYTKKVGKNSFKKRAKIACKGMSSLIYTTTSDM